MPQKVYKTDIVALRQAEPMLTYREIAGRLGCSPSTVAEVCRMTGVQAGFRGRRDFSEVLKLGNAAKRAGLTLQQIEGMANGH